MNTASLMGKTIVITGASSGVGRAAASEFARYGTALVLAGRNEKVLLELAAECTDAGADAMVVVTDVTDPKEMVHLANEAYQWKGKIDVWVNNAGVLAAGAFDNTPMEVHQRVITTNLLGYMNGAHAVLPFFKTQQYGVLINNISIGGFLPVPYGSAYTASKFGLRGFCEALKGELSHWPEIFVCDLFPAFLNTPGIQHAANYTGKVLKPAPPVYDPLLVAQAMVRLAIYPKSDTYIGSTSLLLKSMHALAPELTTRITGKVMRNYFKAAEPISVTKGNLYETVEFGMSTHGGSVSQPTIDRKYKVAGILASLAVGFLFVYAKRK